MDTVIYHPGQINTVPSVVTVGCFDGVHAGHQLLISEVVNEAHLTGRLATVVTFDRQPRQLFDPQFQPLLLSSPDEQQQWIVQTGVDLLVILPFTHSMASLSARDFMDQVLRQSLAADVLVTGYDNRFGHNRLEGFEQYVAYGQALGISVRQGGVVCFSGSQRAVSSSAIRALLAEGDVRLAAEGLTRPYTLTGMVVGGHHIGRTLGFPTANLQLSDQSKVIPSSGVYAVMVTYRSQLLPGMMNIGTRPTFSGDEQTLEVNILHEVGNIYGELITIHFIERLRSERHFDSPEALTSQLKRDREDALRAIHEYDLGHSV